MGPQPASVHPAGLWDARIAPFGTATRIYYQINDLFFIPTLCISLPDFFKEEPLLYYIITKEAELPDINIRK